MSFFSSIWEKAKSAVGGAIDTVKEITTQTATNISSLLQGKSVRDRQREIANEIGARTQRGDLLSRHDIEELNKRMGLNPDGTVPVEGAFFDLITRATSKVGAVGGKVADRVGEIGEKVAKEGEHLIEAPNKWSDNMQLLMFGAAGLIGFLLIRNDRQIVELGGDVVRRKL